MTRRIEQLESGKLSEFDRLIPVGGILILPGVLYVDVNDIPDEDRLRGRKTFYEDPAYQRLYLNRRLWKGGNEIGRRYCSYVYKDGDLIGNIVYTEKLDNPHGYGENDYTITKWIYPKYRGTKYSRYASGDLNHMLFISHTANYLYAYVRLTDEMEGLWNRIDPTLPCLGKIYPTDGPTVQKYISIKREFITPLGTYGIMELDGTIYRRMDLIEYLLAGGPNRTRPRMKEMLKCMNDAAEIVRSQVRRSNVCFTN